MSEHSFIACNYCKHWIHLRHWAKHQVIDMENLLQWMKRERASFGSAEPKRGPSRVVPHAHRTQFADRWWRSKCFQSPANGKPVWTVYANGCVLRLIVKRAKLSRRTWCVIIFREVPVAVVTARWKTFCPVEGTDCRPWCSVCICGGSWTVVVNSYSFTAVGLACWRQLVCAFYFKQTRLEDCEEYKQILTR